jgi:hypothetical protein
MKPLPPLADLRERFTYNPESGVISYRYACGRKAAGAEAGTIKSRRYRYISYNGESYTAQRIAYALHHGTDPNPYEIDHINRVKDDNRAENLRLADRQLQNDNRPINPQIKPVIITFPDGRGQLIVDRAATAARILNRPQSTIYRAIKAGSVLRWGLGCKAPSSGIRVAYA